MRHVVRGDRQHGVRRELQAGDDRGTAVSKKQGREDSLFATGRFPYRVKCDDLAREHVGCAGFVDGVVSLIAVDPSRVAVFPARANNNRPAVATDRS